MKRLLFLAFIGGGASLFFYDDLFDRNDIIPCVKPEGFPDWLDWDCEKQEAYNSGDYYFNDDSTVFAFPTDRSPLDSNSLVSVRLNSITR